MMTLTTEYYAERVTLEPNEAGLYDLWVDTIDGDRVQIRMAVDVAESLVPAFSLVGDDMRYAGRRAS